MYGYLPPSSHLVVTPVDADGGGFVDGSPHRAALPSAYHRYLATGADPFYRADTEEIQMLLRPLFFTSFLIDDQLDDEGLATRGPILISSASSKTAIAAAFLLAQREGVELVGLTSPRNAEFVEGLGIYDRTVAYDAIDSLERGPATYVDVAGDGEVRQAVHSHYGDELVHSMAVGRHPLGGARRRRRRAARARRRPSSSPRPGRQALRGLGPRRPRDRGSPRPGTRSASGPAAGWRRSPGQGFDAVQRRLPRRARGPRRAEARPRPRPRLDGSLRRRASAAPSSGSPASPGGCRGGGGIARARES